MAVRVGFGGGVESWSGLGGDDCIGDGWWGGVELQRRSLKTNHNDDNHHYDDHDE